MTTKIKYVVIDVSMDPSVRTYESESDMLAEVQHRELKYLTVYNVAGIVPLKKRPAVIIDNDNL